MAGPATAQRFEDDPADALPDAQPATSQGKQASHPLALATEGVAVPTATGTRNEQPWKEQPAELLTVAEAASIAGFTIETVRRYCVLGKIPSRVYRWRCGLWRRHKRYILRADLDRYIGRQVKPAPSLKWFRPGPLKRRDIELAAKLRPYLRAFAATRVRHN